MVFIPYYEIDTPEKKVQREEDLIIRAIGERNMQILKVCDAISTLALFANEKIVKKPENAS